MSTSVSPFFYEILPSVCSQSPGEGRVCMAWSGVLKDSIDGVGATDSRSREHSASGAGPRPGGCDHVWFLADPLT